MFPTREHLRILLLEARQDAEMIEHERGCLQRAGRLGPDQIHPFDVIQKPPDPALLEGYHAVVIGGTGDYSVARNRPPFFDPLVGVVRHCLDEGLPMLGLCYGFHLMGHAVGGRVETRPDMGETGTFEVTLTEHGRRDPLFEPLPPRFLAQQGHHDVVLEVPEPFLLLASTERCPIQAFRHPDKPFYGLQFHPELGRADFMRRMVQYADSYASTPEVFAAIDAQVKETTIYDVIQRWVDRVVLPRARARAHPSEGTPVAGPKLGC